MPRDCLFCRIVDGEEPSEVVHTDDDLVVIKDKFPQAPVHLLVLTREHIPSAHDLTGEHDELVAACFRAARLVAEEHGTAGGYRIATNIGTDGGQAIPHLHFHVLGGRQLGRIDDAQAS